MIPRLMKNDTKISLKKPRLVILLQDLEYGGTQRYVSNLLKHLDRNLFTFELWILRGGTDMVPELAETGTKMIWMSKSHRLTPIMLIRLLWNLIFSRPHILYTLTVVPNIWGRIFGKITGVPVIVSGYRSLYPKQYEKLLWRLSHRIICNADILKERMVNRLHIDSKRIDVIPNGVDADFFIDAKNNKPELPIILFAGRLVPEKDPMSLIRAFRMVSNVFPDARLEIVGNGPLKDRLLSYISSHSLESNAELFPGTDDIRSFYRRSCVLVLPSVQEASPNVIIEAMACGIPVVATCVGGIPELVEHGKTGLLTQPGDHQDLAKAIIALLKDKPKRLQMGISGRENILNKFTIEKVIQQTEKVLCRAIRDDGHDHYP